MEGESNERGTNVDKNHMVLSLCQEYLTIISLRLRYFPICPSLLGEIIRSLHLPIACRGNVVKPGVNRIRRHRSKTEKQGISHAADIIFKYIDTGRKSCHGNDLLYNFERFVWLVIRELELCWMSSLLREHSTTNAALTSIGEFYSKS